MPSPRRRRTHTGGRLALRSGADLRKRSAQVPTTRCVNGGKRRYFTRGDAALVLAGLDRDNPRRREQRIYECPACHGWHLTSQSLAEYLNELEPRPRPRPALSFDGITAGPVPSPAEVAARLRRPAAAPEASPAASFLTRVRTLLRSRIRRALHHPLPVVPAGESRGNRS